MPVISFTKWDLERLVGEKLSEDELKRLLSNLKGEIEKIEDECIEMEITHDRPDMFSVEGIARTLKGILEIEIGPPKVDVKFGTYVMYVDYVPWRRFVVTSIVRDVVLDDEAIRQLMQLQEKLHQTYGRDRRVVAIGLYDADLIKFPIRYTSRNVDSVRYRPLGYDRYMSGREVLKETEKGQKYGYIALGEGNKVPIILDSEDNCLVIIPILNSDDYKVTENTKNIMIDITGTDLRRVLDVYKVVIYNVLERSRSKIIEIPKIIFSEEVPNYSKDVESSFEFQTYSISSYEVYDISGVDLKDEDIVKLLLKSRYGVDISNGIINVKVPPYRINVLHKVDIIEDVLIMYGYDNIVRELPTQPTHGRVSIITRIVDCIRNILRGMMFYEVMTYVMTSRRLLELCEQEGIIEVLNPKSELYNCVRTSIWPQLLDFIISNEARARSGFKIFDIGDVAWHSNGKVFQDIHLGIAITGREVTLTDMLTTLRTLFKLLSIDPKYVKSNIRGLIPERTALIYDKYSEVEIGYVGEVHPKVLTSLEYYNPVVIAEISITKIQEVLSRR